MNDALLLSAAVIPEDLVVVDPGVGEGTLVPIRDDEPGMKVSAVVTGEDTVPVDDITVTVIDVPYVEDTITGFADSDGVDVVVVGVPITALGK